MPQKRCRGGPLRWFAAAVQLLQQVVGFLFGVVCLLVCRWEPKSRCRRAGDPALTENSVATLREVRTTGSFQPGPSIRVPCGDASQLSVLSPLDPFRILEFQTGA